jgi:hypothetical protein
MRESRRKAFDSNLSETVAGDWGISSFSSEKEPPESPK